MWNYCPVTALTLIHASHSRNIQCVQEGFGNAFFREKSLLWSPGKISPRAKTGDSFCNGFLLPGLHCLCYLGRGCGQSFQTWLRSRAQPSKASSWFLLLLSESKAGQLLWKQCCGKHKKMETSSSSSLPAAEQ